MSSKNNLLAILIVILLSPSKCLLRIPLRGSKVSTSIVNACSSGSVDPGEPLFLTPLIEEGRLEEARTSSSVKHEAFGDTKSNSGYLTVDKAHNTNLFFWFFPAEINYPDAPVILWLQGGPGDSSLIGLFAENGPFNITSDCLITRRDDRWTKTFSVIYIDSPAGTGFSFTDKNGLSKDQNQISSELYEALMQFYTLFPDLQKSSFFIAGESYAGKYVPSLAYLILQKNPTAQLKLNLRGLAIDSGFTDPINQLDYSEFLYEHGLVDDELKSEFTVLQENTAKEITNQDWIAACKNFGGMLGHILDVSKMNDIYNYLEMMNMADQVKQYIGAFVNQNDIRSAIHVGKNTYSNGEDLYENLKEDYMKSVADEVSELLSHYRILIYNGQVDVSVPYPLMVNYLQRLQFEGDEYYNKWAYRYIWKVGDDVAGYVKTSGRLTEVMVRNAGHMIGYNQPKWCYNLITKFINDEPFS